MGFFFTTPFDVKPSDLLEPDRGHPQLENCVAWWPFIGGVGIPRDFIGKRHLENISGDPEWVITRRGQAYSFDGTNDYAEPNDGYPTEVPLAFSAWVKVNDISNIGSFLFIGEDGNEHGLLHVNNEFWALSQLGGVYGAAIWRGLTSTTAWYHVVGRFSSVSHRELWVNGVHRDTDNSTRIISATSPGIRIGQRFTAAQEFNGFMEDVRVYTTLTDGQIQSLYSDQWAPFKRNIWVPTEPPGIIELNIDGLNHAHPVDEVDLIRIGTVLPIDNLRHNRLVDSFNLGITVDLFLASLRHVRPVDAIALDVSVDLTIGALRHGRTVNIVDLQELVGVVLNLTDQQHARPVDSLLLDVDQLIIIDGLRHRRPIDAAGVQPLLGDQTGIGATASDWILDAGQPLNNAALVNFDYHVLEGVFDSNQSVLGVDGTRVTGPAGMRELTALTFGANVDGQERVQGEIAELRIYAGALSQADRDRILQELQQKWITG